MVWLQLFLVSREILHIATVIAWLYRNFGKPIGLAPIYLVLAPIVFNFAVQCHGLATDISWLEKRV